MPAEIEAELIRVLELPGAAVFPESVGIDPATGDAYVGSLADGSLYRLAPGGTSDQKAETWFWRRGRRAHLSGRRQGRRCRATVGGRRL